MTANKIQVSFEMDPDKLASEIAEHVMGRVVAETGDPSWDPDEEHEPETTAPKYGRGRRTIADMVRDIVAERTRRAVDEAVKEIAAREIEAAVRAVLSEGWQRTNTYGEVAGPRMDLKARIGEILREAVEDRYSHSRDKAPRIDTMVQAEVRKALDGEFKPIIAEAAKKLKEAVDGSVRDRLQASLKEALGIR